MLTRRFRTLGRLLALTLTACLVHSTSSRSQTTQPRTGTSPAKSAVKDVLKKKAKAEAAAPPKKSIDLNSATDEELRELPGVGEAYSHRIIEGRPYRTFADLSKAGLPAATVARLEPMAVINPLPAAVNVNHATTQQLQTLPGIGPALAQELIA